MVSEFWIEGYYAYWRGQRINPYSTQYESTEWAEGFNAALLVHTEGD